MKRLYYLSKARDHKAVPTWNYQVVHMRGKFQLIDNFEEMKAILAKQTHHFEQHQTPPWQLSDAPESYIQSECRGIIGFKIVIEQIEGKYKLSQNQSDENKQSVVHCLRQANHFPATQMAELIEKYLKN
ncbi:FMN-binding negative transcriptional regulator [Avibacterium paragallinarum]|uniref:FMN-binding negative transcriptional regulator n=1 Tax=Avibacterium paragallinarum TaxID=728 RepID=UPI00397D3488